MSITNGYGSLYTTITISNNILTKSSNNNYGDFKTTHEINWYKFLSDNNINWNIPENILFTDRSISMKYYTNKLPLYRIYTHLNNDQQIYILSYIFESLISLHKYKTLNISKDDFKLNLYEECINKVKRRYSEIKDILDTYSYINTVNNITLLSFDNILSYISQFIENYINNQSNYFFNIIHGDCQFSNILVNPDGSDLIFIDPRGYFGTYNVFGLAEYDIAKVYFALSGYDIFDKMEITNLNINAINLTIDPFHFDIRFLETKNIISVLVVSIWLGNAHAFKNTPYKVAFSHFYARYLGTLLFK
jgi:hypothetical protein